MPRRHRNAKKFRRWVFYFAQTARLAARRKVLNDIVKGMRRKLEIRGGEQRVELVWPYNVTYDAAVRVLSLATAKDPSFKICGSPTGMPVGCDLSEPGEVKKRAAASEAVNVRGGDMKRRRLCCKVPANRRVASASVADTTCVADTCGVPAPPALQLNAGAVAVKLDDLKRCGLGSDRFCPVRSQYNVVWANVLGRGRFGIVYAGTARVPELLQRRVAIKIMELSDAVCEARRYAAVPPHPNLVQLMDAVVSSRRGDAHDHAIGVDTRVVFGLVFDQYETDAFRFMQTKQFTVGGMRHLLRGVVAGLGHLHESGLAHLDV